MYNFVLQISLHFFFNSWDTIFAQSCFSFRYLGAKIYLETVFFYYFVSLFFLFFFLVGDIFYFSFGLPIFPLLLFFNIFFFWGGGVVFHLILFFFFLILSRKCFCVGNISLLCTFRCEI